MSGYTHESFEVGFKRRVKGHGAESPKPHLLNLDSVPDLIRPYVHL